MLSGWYVITVMQITLKLPDALVGELGNETERSRRVLEALVLQRYLTHEISLGRLAELLDFSRWQAEEFLDRNNAREPYTREMLEQDRKNLAEALKS